ncbi:MAG: SIS domain-containing protein [Spirochaeta sp.]|nr:SIS domain-containing protein [Spirochaeta sp.]
MNESSTNFSPSLIHLTERYPRLQPQQEDLLAAYRVLKTGFTQGKRLFLCGNGGSAADAEHIVGELMKGYLKSRPVSAELRDNLVRQHPTDGEYLADHLQGALPALALTGHASLSSAYANDVAADMVFAQQLYGYGRPGDMLLAISTSGNSANVVNAVKLAQVLDIHSIGLTGADGGLLADLCTVTIRVPETSTPRIQELHLPVYHWLCEALEEHFFRDS